MTFQDRVYRQQRAIRKYAKALNLNLEQACWRWVSKGCAAKWAEKN